MSSVTRAVTNLVTTLANHSEKNGNNNNNQWRRSRERERNKRGGDLNYKHTRERSIEEINALKSGFQALD